MILHKMDITELAFLALDRQVPWQLKQLSCLRTVSHNPKNNVSNIFSGNIFQMHFADYASRSEQLQSVRSNKRIDGQEVAAEILEQLKRRFDALAEEAPLRLKHLYRLRAHYLLLSNIEMLKKKIDFWKSGDSAAAVQRSIKEYKVECKL